MSAVWLAGLLAHWAWAGFTVAAAAAQTARNAMQRDLTATLGAAGATYVRFLFGLPFIALAYLGQTALLGHRPPALDATALLWLFGGAMAQMLATGLMLAGMKARSFVVVTAYIKTEPVFIAIAGTLFLGDHLAPLAIAAVIVATGGVMLMSWPQAGVATGAAEWRATALGLTGGAFFALSAICYRGGLIGLNGETVALIATTGLLAAQMMQCAVILVFLGLFDRPMLGAIARNWRKSLFAGAMGALASQFWLMAFTLTSAAAVRTLALVEVLMAQVVSRRVFRQGVSRREMAGMALIVAGIALLLNA